MPSIGQMIPHNITIGRKEPIATYVALLSLSQKQAMTNPKNWIVFLENIYIFFR